MIKHYFMQALSQLRQQPIIGVVNVLGTMLAIFLIMLVVMIQQVKVAPFPPESNRDRLLHVQALGINNERWGRDKGNGSISVKTAKECYKSLETPEAVSIFTIIVVTAQASIPRMPSVGVDLRQTDDTFWQVFDFPFIDGKPYDKASFEAGLPVAVITESIARALFGTSNVSGREFLLNHAFYKIVGVVKDVSTLADTAYGQVWIPYTSTDIENDTWADGCMGEMSVVILARNRDDFDVIRGEARKKMDAYNKVLAEGGYELVDYNRPYDQEKQAIAFWSNMEPDLKADRRQRVIILVILLLVPAINLSSMTQSRLRRRVSEIGVCRAFGCTRSELIGQILAENFIVTLFAGVLGLLLSMAFAYWGADILFAQPYSQTLNTPTVDASILMHTSTFLWALAFCFLLNLLSSAIPAWKASRTNIVNALNGKLH